MWPPKISIKQAATAPLVG